jgi:hypothetical protein
MFKHKSLYKTVDFLNYAFNKIWHPELVSGPELKLIVVGKDMDEDLQEEDGCGVCGP